MAGKILSVKGLYDDAVKTLQVNLQQGDLKAATFIIEQVDGKAKQKVDVTSNGENINHIEYDFSKITDDKLRSIRDAVKGLERE
jgi:VCBS repeat-containing protein